MNALSIVYANPVSRTVLWVFDLYRHLTLLFSERKHERVAYAPQGTVSDDDRARALLALVHHRSSVRAGEAQCSDIAVLQRSVPLTPGIVESLRTALNRWNLSDGPRLQVIALLCAHYAHRKERMLIRPLLIAQRSEAGSILALELNRLARQYHIGEL